MIEPKPKKCKGNGKAINFKGCGKHTLYHKYGLCKSDCYREWLTTTDNGKIEFFKAINLVSKHRVDLEKATKEKKEQSALIKAKNNIKIIVHAHVRKRDENKPCISCGTSWNKDFQAGHYYSAGSFETLKYNLDNIHGQCVQCNLFKEGNFDNYTLNLPERIGIERFEAVTKLAGIDKQFSKFWDLEKLKEIKKSLSKK